MSLLLWFQPKKAKSLLRSEVGTVDGAAGGTQETCWILEGLLLWCCMRQKGAHLLDHMKGQKLGNEQERDH